jgi:hypothetical protein
MIADFTGSSPQTGGPTNVGPAMALNAVASVVKSYLDPQTPVNHGSFNPLQVINPPGSFLNAILPAPCGGMVECRAIMVALMVSALGQALPERLIGDLKGGANHVYMSGPRPSGDGNKAGLFLLYEYPAGGTGATKSNDGNHVVRAFPEGDFNTVQLPRSSRCSARFASSTTASARVRPVTVCSAAAAACVVTSAFSPTRQASPYSPIMRSFRHSAWRVGTAEHSTASSFCGMAK